MIMKSKQKSKAKKAKKEISDKVEEKVTQPIDSEDEETDLEDEWRRMSDEEECVWDRLEPGSDAETLEEATNRLCMKHMDWEKVKARDIYKLITSFLPESGALQRVTVYPSEEGILQMDIEEAAGPSVIRELDKLANTDGDVKLPAETAKPMNNRKKHSKKGDEPPEDDELVTEEQWRRLKKCRKYEIARLKYYYAILDFDSPETANAVYETVDGAEYESSGCRIDLYFVENGRVVDRHLKGIPNEDKWRALISTWPEQDASDSVSDNYHPPVFTNNALRHSHQFTLSWDETPSERVQWVQSIAERNDFDEDWEQEVDISRYVALSDSDAEEDEEEMERKRKLIRDVLQEVDAKERKKKRRLERGLMKAKAAAGIDVDMDMESSDSEDEEEEEKNGEEDETLDLQEERGSLGSDEDDEMEDEEEMKMSDESEESEVDEDLVKMKKSKAGKTKTKIESEIEETLVKKRKLKASRRKTKDDSEESEDNYKQKNKSKSKMQERLLSEESSKKGGRKRRSQKQLAKAKRKEKEVAEEDPELSLLLSDLNGPKKKQKLTSSAEDPRFKDIFCDPDFAVDKSILSQPARM